MKGYIHSVESFGSVDGPGIRYVIFFSGCVMRCQYCHNPDTWRREAGELYTASELLCHAERFRAYWGTEGGITASGGEPLLQIDFLTELFERAKRKGIHTALDTSGNPFAAEEPFFGKMQELMKYTDLVLLDVKQVDERKHQLLTGHTNKNILEMAQYLSSVGKPVWIRHVLVPGLTDDESSLSALRKFIDKLDNVERVEVLPYHTLGIFKWEQLGLSCPLENTPPPAKEQIEKARKILCGDRNSTL